ncbi:unnamed protein product [Mytilus coruscus]|uniref:C-type lectin domain-containing protein n=1 Tax=Mytilus coruscus TaxID=42192 RepID=A0A6J8EHY0_MYTCO|nr:unnamed protein product [Mytilus coruscus]
MRKKKSHFQSNVHTQHYFQFASSYNAKLLNFKEKGVGEKSSRPRQLQSSAPKVKSTETAGKKTKPAKRKDTRDSKSFKRKDLQVLRRDMFLTRISAFAKGTLVNFKTQWRAYLLFCYYFHLEPFDINVELLCTYSEFLSRSFRSAQSIRNYLNGIKVLFLLLGLHVDVFSFYELKLTMKGLDRKLKHLPKQAFPITLEILGKFGEHLNLNTPLDATYWCLFLFALLLLSRKSNLVPVSTKKFDKNKQLCRGDVTVFQSLIIVPFKWTKTIQLDAVKTECHIGWLHYGYSCYLFSSTKMSWYDAASSCREHGARLAEIETQAEDRYIGNIAATLKSCARDDVIEGTFEWSSGTPFIYTNWHPGEPNDGGVGRSEDCVFTDGGWTDQSCDVTNNYICEKEYPETIATDAPVVGK